ncbi:hypothetical protein D3C71_1489640 [compost metagenome]
MLNQQIKKVFFRCYTRLDLTPFESRLDFRHNILVYENIGTGQAIDQREPPAIHQANAFVLNRRINLQNSTDPSAYRRYFRIRSVASHIDAPTDLYGQRLTLLILEPVVQSEGFGGNLSQHNAIGIGWQHIAMS